MEFDSSESDARLINAAIAQSAEACMLLLHSRPHLRQPLVIGLLRSPHQLDHDSILSIFSLAVFGHEPSEAVEFLRQLKPAGYCGHVFKEGEISYKCAPPFYHDSLSCSRIFSARFDDAFQCRCLDCAADATCVVCAECFHGANHAGHRYIMYSTLAFSTPG